MGPVFCPVLVFRWWLCWLISDDIHAAGSFAHKIFSLVQCSVSGFCTSDVHMYWKIPIQVNSPIKIPGWYRVQFSIQFGTPPPNQKENVKTMGRSNFDAEAFVDMYSTLYNQIWSSANSWWWGGGFIEKKFIKTIYFWHTNIFDLLRDYSLKKIFRLGFEIQADNFFSTFYRLTSTFLPYHVKKHHSTLEMDTFKIMLLLSRTWRIFR